MCSSASIQKHSCDYLIGTSSSVYVVRIVWLKFVFCICVTVFWVSTSGFGFYFCWMGYFGRISGSLIVLLKSYPYRTLEYMITCTYMFVYTHPYKYDHLRPEFKTIRFRMFLAIDTPQKMFFFFFFQTASLTIITYHESLAINYHNPQPSFTTMKHH